MHIRAEEPKTVIQKQNKKVLLRIFTQVKVKSSQLRNDSIKSKKVFSEKATQGLSNKSYLINI